VEAAGKGFAINAGLKGDLALFTVLVRIRNRHSSQIEESGSGHGRGIRYPRIAGAGVATCLLRIAGAGTGVEFCMRARISGGSIRADFTRCHLYP
jgi:hypothetical protein